MGVCFSKSSSVEPRDSADINLMSSKPGDASKKRGWFSRLSRRTPQGESGVAEEPPEPHTEASLARLAEAPAPAMDDDDDDAGPPPMLWGNKPPPSKKEKTEGGPSDAPMPDAEDAPAAPPPPMWGNKKPAAPPAADAPPPPMWGNKKPAAPPADAAPPPPMWGNKKPTRDASSASSASSGYPPSVQGQSSKMQSSTASLLTELSLQSPVSTKFEEGGKKYIKQYEMGDILGRGSYAKVKKCRDVDTNAEYAIKIFKKSLLKKNKSRYSGTQLDDVLREIAIMRKLAHENIVVLRDVIDDATANKLYMVMDMCECSVMDSHHFPVEPLEIGDCKKWWIDAAVGLEYLHFQGVVHFDLKPDNILIAKDADGGTRAVLADFGVSRILHEAGDDKESVGASGSPGTPAYTAPEVWAPEVWSHVGKRQYDPKAADVWSLGITLHAMAFGNVPYTGTLPEIMENVAKTEEWTISDDGHDDKNMVALLRGLITKSPKERMTLADVKKHPWVIGEISKRRRSVEGWQKVEVTDEELRKAIISGHVANFRRTKDGSIFKTTEKSEAHMYNVLNKAESQVKRYLPTVKSPPTRASKGRVTLELADLTHGVDGACLMDIKMGMRAFTDAEDTGPAGERREDMLAKMDKIDPTAATDAEREANGVYKIRYLKFRDEKSTTNTLGFRIDAVSIEGPNEGAVPDMKELRTVSTAEQAQEVMLQYVQRRPEVLASLVPQLREMRGEMEKCAVFMSHSFIRTSLLFKYSNGTNETSVHMIDLKGAAPAPGTLTHRAAYETGNGEDGYLTGVDNLISLCERCEATLRG